jgi:predicted ATPase
MYSEARAEGSGEAASDVLQMLSRVDPRIVGLEVLAARSELEGIPVPAVLYLRDRDAGLLPVSAFGDGMRRILLIAFGVARARGGVLLIDEIETAIHISALGHVFRWLVEACASSDVQLFATTHSLEAIDAILAADTTPEEDIVGYRLEPSGARVVAHRFGEDLLKRLRIERGADVR